MKTISTGYGFYKNFVIGQRKDYLQNCICVSVRLLFDIKLLRLIQNLESSLSVASFILSSLIWCLLNCRNVFTYYYVYACLWDVAHQHYVSQNEDLLQTLTLTKFKTVITIRKRNSLCWNQNWSKLCMSRLCHFKKP